MDNNAGTFLQHFLTAKCKNNRGHYVTNNETIMVYFFVRREKKTETNEFVKKESISEILNTSGGLF